MVTRCLKGDVVAPASIGHKSFQVEYSSLVDSLVSGDLDDEEDDADFGDWMRVVSNSIFASISTNLSFSFSFIFCSILIAIVSLMILSIRAPIDAVRERSMACSMSSGGSWTDGRCIVVSSRVLTNFEIFLSSLLVDSSDLVSRVLVARMSIIMVERVFLNVDFKSRTSLCNSWRMGDGGGVKNFVFCCCLLSL